MPYVHVHDVDGVVRTHCSSIWAAHSMLLFHVVQHCQARLEELVRVSHMRVPLAIRHYVWHFIYTSNLPVLASDSAPEQRRTATVVFPPIHQRIHLPLPRHTNKDGITVPALLPSAGFVRQRPVQVMIIVPILRAIAIDVPSGTKQNVLGIESLLRGPVADGAAGLVVQLSLDLPYRPNFYFGALVPVGMGQGHCAQCRLSVCLYGDKGSEDVVVGILRVERLGTPIAEHNCFVLPCQWLVERARLGAGSKNVLRLQRRKHLIQMRHMQPRVRSLPAHGGHSPHEHGHQSKFHVTILVVSDGKSSPLVGFV
mmetsp:Transcript_36986/g.78104  ORF Transcript_36986/g.78104 Transcript_36986/m.78104 type:complete len:311 (-) Transcript_36986:395-1327(-)